MNNLEPYRNEDHTKYKLLCDKIEKLQAELDKHNRNCERFFSKPGEITPLAKSFAAYGEEKGCKCNAPCWGWAYWLFAERKTNDGK